jgi:AraC-like DNA-binding protein
MELIHLNPNIKQAAIYEKINKTDECVAYDYRILYVISGDLVATVGGEKYNHLGPGNLLLIPAGTPYKLKSKYVRLAVLVFDLTTDLSPCPPPAPTAEFKGELVAAPEEPFAKPIHLPEMESERDTFIRMCNIFTSSEGAYLAEISAMLKLVLLKIANSVEENALPARMVEELDNYIRENCKEEISNTELGAIFGYHPFYISKMLKERKGITLHQYIITYRLKAAKRMLELTDKSAAEIADKCGFTDASYFAKSFKSAFGETPKEYRNRFKEDYI